jgi:hypothetical protein
MNISDHLLKLADRLDTEDKRACADAIDQLIKTASVEKVAQYVGVIGYVLKQNRAIGNCVRKKRVASNRPMQEVVLECLSEYQDGQNYQNTEWASKYAECVKKEPRLFETSHLTYLATIAEENSIGEHLENVRTAATVLQENDIEDEMISKVLSHAETFGEILRKESQSRPFELTAPRLPSRRTKWQRRFNPTEKTWNPLSWFRSRRERGQDQETTAEMAIIASELHEITRIAQQMRTAMFRLKNQVGGYLAGSFENLPASTNDEAAQTFLREDSQLVNSVTELINKLNPNDWNASILAIHQLQWLLNNRKIRNQYNQTIYDQAAFLASDLAENIDVIYEKLETLQEIMSTLGQREPILGTELASDPTERANPGVDYSAVEEFGVLERVLDKIYRNPFDEEAHYEAKRAHARLERKLRYAEPQAAPAPSSQAPSQAQPTPGTQQRPNARPEPTTGPVNQDRVNNTSNWLRNHMSEHNITVEALEDAFRAVIRGLGNETPISDETVNYINAIFDHLRQPAGETGDPILDALPTEESVRPYGGQTPGEGIDLGEAGEERNEAATIENLVKIADLMDRVDPDIANLIDQFIEEQMNGGVNELPQQPEFSAIVKEKEGASAISN